MITTLLTKRCCSHSYRYGRVPCRRFSGWINPSQSTARWVSRIACVVALWASLPLTASAGQVPATLESVDRGTVQGQSTALRAVDGLTMTLLPNAYGRSSTDLSFHLSGVPVYAGGQIVINVKSQQRGVYRVWLTQASGTGAKLLGNVRCYLTGGCGISSVSFPLPSTVGEATRKTSMLLTLDSDAGSGSLSIDRVKLDYWGGNGTLSPTTNLSLQAPIATNDTVATPVNTPIRIPVLSNDRLNGLSGSLYIRHVGAPGSGRAYIEGNNVVYRPPTNYTGRANFAYDVVVGNSPARQAWVSVAIGQGGVTTAPAPVVTLTAPIAATPVTTTTASSTTQSVTTTTVTPVATVTNRTRFTPGGKLYWQLQGSIDASRNVDVFGFDLEDNERNGLIRLLKSRGKKVICYFSAGSYESWRSDAGRFNFSTDIGKALGNWPGEYYLNIRSSNVRSVMKSRLVRAANAGCDAVEPDNTDAYQAQSGLNITAAQQIDYLKFLAREAHALGLSIGLKNTVDLIATGRLYDVFDWAMNESCYTYSECFRLTPFISRNKAVYIAQYQNTVNRNWCNNAASNRFDLSFYNANQALDGSRYQPCQ